MWRSSIAVIVIALSACAGSNAGPVSTPPTTAASTPDPSGPHNPATPTTAAEAPGNTADTNTATANTALAAAVDVSAGAAVMIDAHALPSEVSNAIHAGGGELATTEAWVGRFAPVDMPLIGGAGVHLVEADVEVTRTDTGWRRVDAMQWLYVDGAGSGVADTLEELAGSAGIGEWNRLDDSDVIDAAPCVTRSYTVAGSDESWILQGCEFPAYAGMVSIGVTHTTTPDESTDPPTIDPSVPHVVADSGGTIEHVTARFGPPATVDSTSTLTATVTVTPGVDAVGDRLAASALAGWSVSSGEANSTVFVGAPGQSWTVTANMVRYSSQGRLAP